jgi:Protein of unknown function (DUF4232)
MRRSFVTAALTLALVAGCGPTGPASTASSSAPPSATATAKPLPAPSPSASAARTPVPDPPGGPPRCHTPQLRVAYAGEQGAAGHVFLTFRMTNATPAMCSLFGFVGMLMLDSSGSELPTRVVRNGGQLTSQPGPSRFDLAGGQAATFTVSYGQVPVGNETRCPEAARLIVTPPDELENVTLEVGGFRLAPCNAGELDVTPMRPPGAGS